MCSSLCAWGGIGFTAIYIIGSQYAGMEPWCFGIRAQGIGVIGMAINFIVTLSLAPLFPPPGTKVQRMMDELRAPEREGAE